MTPVRWLSFRWSPEQQEMAVDGEAFAHSIATPTSPSHDLAHLLVAASNLPWRPRGTRDDVCFAEYNSVFIENLAVNAFDAVHLGRAGSALARTIDHAAWFAERHYAPFPVSAEKALANLAEALDVDAIVRLSPLFFRLRAFEIDHVNFRAHTFGARFSSSFAPIADAVSREPQRRLVSELSELRALHDGRARR